MFLSVQTFIPSLCQQRPETFKAMRRMNHYVLSTETLASYLEDLHKAVADGRNLLTEKYARMDNLIPCLNTNPVIDKIVEAEGGWLKELSDRHPSTFPSQSDYASNVYLRSELETYSAPTLELYFKDVCKAVEERRNLAAERYTSLFQQIGYSSIDELESKKAPRTL